MKLSELLTKEIQQEAASTRKILKAVADEHFGWKPHEKSMTLGRMATHIAELPHWIIRVMGSDDFDMAAQPYQPVVCENNAQLLQFFEEKLSAALEGLQTADNDALAQQWTFRRGEMVIAQSSRYEAIRSWMMNHQVHHRGQLSVYLRLLDIPVPGMYGPSADDIIARQKAAEAAKAV
jgi:uncharacterized damage-inducible protein DinB